MATSARPFAVITGASSGIGYDLAAICAENQFDVLLAADEPEVEAAAREMQAHGVTAEFVQADLSTTEGVDKLIAAIAGRPVDALLANAGRGLGRAFLDQDFAEIMQVVNTNITGTIYLIHKIGQQVRQRKQGRILITGSIAGLMPGTYQAVYNGTKAFLDSFAFAIRHELHGSGVSVSVLMPGATETEFFERADMLDTKVGTQKKQDPREVAEAGFKAMMAGDGEVVAGWQNKLQAAIARILPAGVVARRHAAMAAPGTAKQ